MIPADVKLDIRDVWGRPVKDAVVDVVEERQQGGKHLVAKVTALGYLRDRIVPDFRGRGEVVLLLDPEQCECVAMLPGPRTGLKGRRATTDRETIARLLLESAGKHLGVYEHGLAIAKLAPDRVWWYCKPSLGDQLDHSGAWSADLIDGRGHEYEDGWKIEGSWRSNTHVVSMQAVVYRDRMVPASYRDPHPVVELDLDMGGLRHVKQVLGNAITGGKTEPVIMAQLAHYYWGLRLPFELRPKGRDDESGEAP